MPRGPRLGPHGPRAEGVPQLAVVLGGVPRRVGGGRAGGRARAVVGDRRAGGRRSRGVGVLDALAPLGERARARGRGGQGEESEK